MVEVAVDDSARGPVARACGIARDARTGDTCYTRLGFKPVVVEGGDALARVRVRMEEIVRSLNLVRAMAGALESAAVAIPPNGGSGEAMIETPRGAATLAIVVEDGMVRKARLDTPGAAHFALIDEVVLNQELGDALVGMASLDLSP
jgi:Ni,Fe-hydrogenase III large subunit